MTLSAPAPAWHQVTARVLRQVDYGSDHLWLDLETPGTLELPRPGQFVQLLMPPTRAAALLPRPMSVASARRVRGRTVLGFLYAQVGAGTHALASLERGAEVQLLGPLGRGFPLDRPGTPVLIAGGRGVAPLLFAADELARARRRCEFLFGARGRQQLVGLDDARRRLTRMHGRLHLCTDDGSRGWCGHVVSLLERVSPRFQRPLVIHACGPHAMLSAIARFCLGSGTPAYLAMESVMACGTGVCRGCPLPRSESSRREVGHRLPSLLGNRDYAMCCTEGPVFAAGDLDWSRIE